MSSTRSLFSDQARCFNQSERARYIWKLYYYVHCDKTRREFDDSRDIHSEFGRGRRTGFALQSSRATFSSLSVAPGPGCSKGGQHYPPGKITVHWIAWFVFC